MERAGPLPPVEVGMDELPVVSELLRPAIQIIDRSLRDGDPGTMHASARRIFKPCTPILVRPPECCCRVSAAAFRNRSNFLVVVRDRAFPRDPRRPPECSKAS